MNRKGQMSKFSNIMIMIIVFSILIFFFLFFTVGLKQIMSENILDPIINASLTSTASLIDNNTVTAVNNMKALYDLDWFNFDLFFLVFVIFFVFELFYTASKIELDNMFSILGLVTIGNLVFLFLLTFVGTVRDWLVLNFYTNLFDLTLVNTPIIDFFLSNIDIISFILFLSCILIAALDWQTIKGKVSRSQTEERIEE